MKPSISGPSKPLLEALAKASLALPSRVSLPQLTLVKIESAEKLVTLSADCLDAAITVSVEGLTIKGQFSTLVSPRLLKASLRGEEFELVLEDNKMLVESAGRSVISCGDVKEFPPQRVTIPVQEVDAKSLLLGIKCGLNCADPQPDSPRNGVVWDHEMRAIVGGDGKAIHVTNIDLGLDQTLIIPRFSASMLSTLVSWEEPLYLGLEKHTLHVQQGPAQAWMQLQDGRTASMKRMFEGESDRICCVSREDLSTALENLTPFAGPTLGRLKVHVTPTHMVLSVSYDGNKSSASVECILGATPSTFPVLLASLSRAIRFWSSDTVRIGRKDNLMHVSPEDNSGCRAGVVLIRDDEPQDKP